MADNITLDAGTGGATMRTDDDGTAHWQYVKLAFGADNTQTIVGSISSNPFPVALSDTDNAVLDNIATSLALLDNAIASGNELQVDVVAALPTGANTIGGVTISGAALTALQLIDNPVAVLGTATYTETSTSGMIMGAVRNDVLGALAGTDNEIAPLQVNASGALFIQEGAAMDVSAATLTVNAHAVTNAGTFAVQVDGDALTALQLIDNVVVVEDAAAAANPTGNMMMTVRDDEVGSTAIANADNDIQALRSNQFGELKVTQIPDSTSEFKYAIIDAASSGNNTIQASAGAGKKIRVVAGFLVSAGTVNTRFESGADGTALTGQMNLVVNTGFVLPYNPAGWFETADDALLNLELSAGVSVDGSITYVEI